MKVIKILRNIFILSLILISCFGICITCDIKKISAEDKNAISASVANDLVMKPKKSSSSDLDSISHINSLSYTTYSSAPPVTTLITTTPLVTSTSTVTTIQWPPSNNSITNDFFTVYDVNSRQNVTMNGFDLICQVVRNEVGAHYKAGPLKGQTAYNKEAIKAFAVASYTYIKYNINRGQVPCVGLNSDISQALMEDVAEVYGQAIYYNNAYICAVYCASTGGYTLSSKNSWGQANPYLISVESKYDSQGNQYIFKKVFTKDEIRNIIGSRTGIVLSDDPSKWITIASNIDGNNVDQVLIDGNPYVTVEGRQYRITGTYFKNNIIGSGNVKSPAFTVEYKDGTFCFTSYGFGHGVGMPADGANLYAKIAGWDYKQILTHYYSGVEVG